MNHPHHNLRPFPVIGDVFNRFTKLGDFSVINRRIWNQPGQHTEMAASWWTLPLCCDNSVHGSCGAPCWTSYYEIIRWHGILLRSILDTNSLLGTLYFTLIEHINFNLAVHIGVMYWSVYVRPLLWNSDLNSKGIIMTRTWDLNVHQRDETLGKSW